MPNDILPGAKKSNGQAAWLMGLALIPAAISAFLHPQRPYLDWIPCPEPEVSMAEAEKWGPHVIWVDTRGAGYFEASHIPGALLINEDNWNQQILQFTQNWSDDQRVVVYCDTGRCRSSQVISHRLRKELSISRIYVLQGGWKPSPMQSPASE